MHDYSSVDGLQDDYSLHAQAYHVNDVVYLRIVDKSTRNTIIAYILLLPYDIYYDLTKSFLYYYIKSITYQLYKKAVLI